MMGRSNRLLSIFLGLLIVVATLVPGALGWSKAWVRP